MIKLKFQFNFFDLSLLFYQSHKLYKPYKLYKLYKLY